MILADTSVWIGHLRDEQSLEGAELRRAIVDGKVYVGDLVLVEVLQGIREDGQKRQTAHAFSQLPMVTLCGPDIAPRAADNYRALRRKGLTVRGTIDVIIATWCIENRVALLHNDRDFDVMEKHLGLACHR